MSQFQRPDRHPEPVLRDRGDAGFTLPELLIAMMISGILIVSISMAFTTVLRTQAQATDRLAESKDITFVQTWLPVDLSSALATTDAPTEAGLIAWMAALNPPMSILNPAGDPTVTGLPGTNVLTVLRPDLEAGPKVYYLVSYRYHQVDGKWQISRFEITNPGQPNQVIKTVGVAHEIPAPPPGWVDGVAKPTHAVVVTARNQVILRPVGEDVQVNFESGNSFKSGGAGLSAENELPAGGGGKVENPDAPPSRCGGRLALLIDTSGSIATYEPQVMAAANSFINSFSGTPYMFTLNGFSTEAYGMTGVDTKLDGERAPYVSMLNGGAPVAALTARVNKITVGGSTNWSDGLNILFAKDNGTFAGAPYGVDQPDLIVFITDGDPTVGRSTTNGKAVFFFPDSGATQKQNRDAAATQAFSIANAGRLSGTKTIGIMVGPTKPANDSVARLLQVVGPTEWNGKILPDGNLPVPNAESADLFRGSFAELGNVLRSILIAECGGTLTLQKRIQVGSGPLDAPSAGTFSFATSIGGRALDAALTSSVTLDYAFKGGEINKTVEIRETTVGQVFKGAQCTAGGVPIPSPLLTDGTAGVSVTVSVDKAVSCIMISEPTAP